ncbi:uncharacterized protein LOC117321800 [Pecten maximus]|uniref:uncharacterized protein LOC117321800 n=1 Tax=Pecten maximus TaxID=6579 RepID=UPI001458C606|nr:uncharacterized protein LOC117321800 [Pecten maximus]XP_033732267.1 uncharacterized protein LOC117321800 [Pecten maximus]
MHTLSLILGLCLVTGSLGGHGHASNIDHDSPEARELFLLADIDHDYMLSTTELHSVFLEFDMNNDTIVTSDEFLADWMARKLGDSIEAVVLFHHLDVDRDGVIHEDTDLPWIIHFFDRDHDGVISQAEFVVQWIKIMISTPS